MKQYSDDIFVHGLSIQRTDDTGIIPYNQIYWFVLRQVRCIMFSIREYFITYGFYLLTNTFIWEQKYKLYLIYYFN